VGSGPEILVEYMLKTISDDRNPMTVGIVPPNFGLDPTYKAARDDRNPIVEGRLPDMLVDDNDNSRSDLKYPIAEGIVPVKEFLFRFKFSSDWFWSQGF